MAILEKKTWVGLIFFLACQLSCPAQLKWEHTEQVFQANLADASTAAEYPFSNEGSKPVSILKIESSCGCVTVQADKKTYAPDEKGKITAQFAFDHRNGLQIKEFLVKTDENPGLYLLRLKGSIPAPFDCEPKSLAWSKEEANTPKVIRLTPHPQASELIPEITTPKTPFYTASLTRSPTGGFYEIRILPLAPRASIRTLIQVETGHPRQKTINIPIQYQ
jgi:hypothetical protein